ncbi:MAG: M48 family metalloprotease [Planctomycetes bacterium]|nr:M48 family metalloprotease [Planctomycetota bacterium]
MFSEYLNNTNVGEGFLNLFLNLFVLTLVTSVLLIVSRKWMSSTRSFLLMGIILGYVLIIGVNLVFFAQPDSRYSVVSLTLPAIDAEPLPLALSDDIALGRSSENLGLLLESEIPLEPIREIKPASVSRTIMAVATIAGVIWLCGSMVFLIRLGVSLIRLECFKQRLCPLKDERIPELLAKVKAKLELKETPQIYCSAEIESPMTIGVFRSMIVMPEKIVNVTSREEYLCILGHESDHIKHRDNLTGLVQRVFIGMNWWNPLAYIISARYTLTREDICDSYAVEMIDDRNRYTRCLINLAEKNCLISSFVPAVGLVGSKNSLAKRLTRILEKEKNMNMNLTKTKKLMLAGLCFAMILGCVGIQTVFAQDVEAVGRRLRAAVQAGELTAEQAGVMMDSLLQQADRDQRVRINEREAIARRIREIEEAVRAGKMTREEGARLIESTRQRGGGEQQRITREEYAKAAEEIRKAVEAGRISEEDAKIRLEEMRRVIERQRVTGQEQQRITREEYAKAVEEIRKAVEAGRISEEDAKIRLEEMRRMIGRQRVAGSEQTDMQIGIARRIREIEEMVKAGKMTWEEGAKAIESTRNSGGDERTRAAAARIRAAVEAGTMTREEAAAALKRLGIIR